MAMFRNREITPTIETRGIFHVPPGRELSNSFFLKGSIIATKLVSTHTMPQMATALRNKPNQGVKVARSRKIAAITKLSTAAFVGKWNRSAISANLTGRTPSKENANTYLVATSRKPAVFQKNETNQAS